MFHSDGWIVRQTGRRSTGDWRAVTRIGILWRQESGPRADRSERSKALDLRLSDSAYSFSICLINNNNKRFIYTTPIV